MKNILDRENQKVDKRFNKLEGEIEKLNKKFEKIGINNVSEAASNCQMLDEEDLEDNPDQEDTSYYLAVHFPSNIVATGSLMGQVIMDSFIQGEALLPIPIEEESIFIVKDAIGHDKV
ncbi:hypothetical protein LXL04_029758 [Taraxacum kok-saghyz]